MVLPGLKKRWCRTVNSAPVCLNQVGSKAGWGTDKWVELNPFNCLPAKKHAVTNGFYRRVSAGSLGLNTLTNRPAAYCLGTDDLVIQ